MLFENSFPGRVRFVAHAVREIRNRLPDVISGSVARMRLDYINRLDDLAKKWQRAGFPIDGSLPTKISLVDEARPSDMEIPMPLSLYRDVARLVRDHFQTRVKPVDAAKRLFQAIDPNNEQDEATLRPRIENWLDVTEWFVRRVHDNGLTDDQLDVEDVLKKFEIFETALFALTSPFFETLGELDEILEEANS